MYVKETYTWIRRSRNKINSKGLKLKILTVSEILKLDLKWMNQWITYIKISAYIRLKGNTEFQEKVMENYCNQDLN